MSNEVKPMFSAEDLKGALVYGCDSADWCADFANAKVLPLQRAYAVLRQALDWYASPSSYCGSAEDPEDGVIPGHRVQCGYPMDPPDYDWEPDCGEVAIKALAQAEKIWRQNE